MNSDLLNVFCSVLISNFTIHPVKCELVFDEKIDYDIITNTYSFDIEEIKDINWNTLIKNKNYTYLCMYCNSIDIENYDEDDFIWEIENKNGINLKNVVEGCYRLKSLKYDYEYEIFEGLTEEVDEYYNFKDYCYNLYYYGSNITYNVEFDHL